jgi:hypothetical protein
LNEHPLASVAFARNHLLLPARELCRARKVVEIARTAPIDIAGSAISALSSPRTGADTFTHLRLRPFRGER